MAEDKIGVRENMNKLFDSLLNLVFPPRCEVCRTGSVAALCLGCFCQVKFMQPQYGIYSVAAYANVLKTAIHRFKFQKRKKLAKPLGMLLVKYIAQMPAIRMQEMDAIVPVPLHPKRLGERGFNQVDLLANVISRYYEKPVVPALKRVKNTHAQFDLPREKRFENIQGAFAVAENNISRGKQVLLLDDIYTTGSTIAECVKTLKSAGAQRVEVVTLARAIEKD